jgi:hypothetical protein
LKENKFHATYRLMITSIEYKLKKIKIMKTLNSFLLLMLVSFGIFAQKDTDKPYMVKTFTASAIKNLKMTTSGGSLSVIGTKDAEAKLEVYVYSNNSDDNLSKEEIEERLQNYELSVSQNGDAIVAFSKSKMKSWNKKSLNIAFKAYVPENITTDINTSGGSINVKGISGNAVGNTSGGSINVRNCKNKIDLKTSGGSITANDCSGSVNLSTSGGSITANDCDGTIDLSTSGGSLTLEALKGTIKAVTSGGSITASELRGESVVRTSGGSIRLRRIYGALEASTSAGSVDAEILELGKYLNINVTVGSLSIKLPMNKGLTLDCSASKIDSESLNNFSGQFDKKHIKGTLNGGGVPVKLVVNSGNLTMKGL